MTDRKRTDRTVVEQPDRRPMDDTAFKQLLDEGRASRRAFERHSAGLRALTPDDLKVRSR